MHVVTYSEARQNFASVLDTSKKDGNWTGTTDLGAYFVSTCSSHLVR